MDKFWSKPLSSRKVRRILDGMGVDSESFRQAYEGDTSRPHDTTEPTQDEIAAVQRYLETQDLSVLPRRTAEAKLRLITQVTRKIDLSQFIN